MKSIIRRLYEGELVPMDKIFPEDPEYQHIWNKIIQTTELVMEKLPAEETGSMEKLEELYCTAAAMETYAGFAYGLRLGVELCRELFSSDL